QATAGRNEADNSRPPVLNGRAGQPNGITSTDLASSVAGTVTVVRSGKARPTEGTFLESTKYSGHGSPPAVFNRGYRSPKYCRVPNSSSRRCSPDDFRRRFLKKSGRPCLRAVKVSVSPS